MSNKIPARNLIKFSSGLLPGEIILLWRINFGTFNNRSHFPKYFSQTYGIDAPVSLNRMVEDGFVGVDDVYDSLEEFATVDFMRRALRDHRNISGLSKEGRNGLLDLMEVEFSEKDLESLFEIRGYSLTEKGQEALLEGQEAVDRHPKKKF
ncbi:MAG: hypothetical protein Q4A21_02100 [bacterium]|nr:hypothetical protein [bacterium]